MSATRRNGIMKYEIREEFRLPKPGFIRLTSFAAGRCSTTMGRTYLNNIIIKYKQKPSVAPDIAQMCEA
ncbi:hypothetical protein Desti_5124 [Desulfomonile tiedjei DSM 6799]|uniref:Uncharacterized protein n=1 Tax=Desulfomonile tiedjei (strain ATCC 49306 / DSM 6799 / DCB-1) TaxID=706587 RepID=I4CDT8_DESTA|nr:hypothetical protein Desti_5124 [Desulfomonile tiedjei DSM 6799]